MKSRKRFFALSQLAALAAMSLAVSEAAFSHGYVSSPASRSMVCKEGRNVNCGSVQYEPQSVEGPDGFPQGGPADGTIAGGGAWSELYAQTADRWQKHPIQAGSRDFSWHFTAAHVTKDWKYYITKDNWNPNQPLTRASLDLTPFCEVSGGMQKPNPDVTHKCNIPARQGYHVILATWDVGDTDKTFYNVIDVNFSGGNPPPTGGGNNPPPTGGGGNNPPPTGGGNNPPPGGGGNNPPPPPPPPPAPDCDPGSGGGGGGGGKQCKAVSGSGASDSWCDTNCNHTPSFCPATHCKCN